MSTLSRTESLPHATGTQPRTTPSAMQKAGRLLLAALAAIITLLSLLIIAILPLGTAVPAWLWAPLALADLGLLALAFRGRWTPRASGTALGGALAIILVAVAASQALAATPPIVGADGKPVPGSIATLEKVTLNGSEQWITIRGYDVNKPVLLYLGMGGPGGGGFATRGLFEPLEEHFVVVAWDEPGTGKSYNAVPFDALTTQRFIDDAHALTQLLRERFHQDKIYVYGVSWTSILGIWLVDAYPELYHAYIGNGQMVNTTENDRLGYALALDYLAQRGDTAQLERLRRNGPPPYNGPAMLGKYVAYLDVLNEYMGMPRYTVVVPIVPLFAPEYGLIDKVNHTRGLIESFQVVYPQLRDLDFETQAPRLEVPVYFLVGRNDVNAMASLVERYYNKLEAPRKELIWLEAGHGLNADNLPQFVDVMTNKVLKETYPSAPPLPPAAGVFAPAEVKAFLDDLLRRQLRENHIAGAAVAVVKDGELLVAEGYGSADLAAHKPVVADQTLFRTDSTGKLFVWTAVMQLVEQGRLDLNADVNTYLDFRLPDTFPQPITLAHLMTHSAGFDDQGYLAAHTVEDLAPTGQWLADNIPARVRPPGEVSGYSNYGVGLAGYIVERVSGLPFEQYMEERIFAPLGMARSTFRQPVPPALAADTTTNYQYAGGQLRTVPDQYLRIPATGEGHMTVTDMARFMLAHLQAGDSPVLSGATTRQMHTQLFTNDPRASGLAYGFVESVQNGQRLLRHEGNLVGVSSTALFLVPEQNLGVYVAYNSNGGFGPGEEFRRAFLDHYFPAEPVPPRPAALTREQARALAGTYRSTRMFSTTFGKVMRLLGGNYADIVITANPDGTFTTRGLGAGPVQWVAVGPDVLRLADGAQNSHGDLIFNTDARGNRRLVVANNPYRACEKVAWYEGVGLHLAWLVVVELVLAGALLARPVGWLLRGVAPALYPQVPSAAATWLLTGACLLAVVFPVGLVLTLPEALVYGVTLALGLVLALPIAALLMGAAALALVAPRWAGLSRLARFGYTTTAAALLGFAGWLAYWNLLGWRY